MMSTTGGRHYMTKIKQTNKNGQTFLVEWTTLLHLLYPKLQIESVPFGDQLYYRFYRCILFSEEPQSEKTGAIHQLSDSNQENRAGQLTRFMRRRDADLQQTPLRGFTARLWYYYTERAVVKTDWNRTGQSTRHWRTGLWALLPRTSICGWTRVGHGLA